MDERFELTFNMERCKVIYDALNVYRTELYKPEYQDFPGLQSTLYIIDEEIQRFAP